MLAVTRRATRGGPGGPDPCPFFKRAKLPFSGERLCEMEALLICIWSISLQSSIIVAEYFLELQIS